MTWTVKNLSKDLKNGKLSFDYPIQRAGGQWDNLQKSLLIHSIACDFPVPPLYALAQNELVGEGEKAKQTLVYYLLDGKQRTTNIIEFVEGGYRLDKETPTFNIDDESFELAELNFEELPEKVKEAILDFNLDAFRLEDCLDSEIEDMFFRLNNGTSLTQVQKAKAKMGGDSATLLQGLSKHKVMTENAVFTSLQIRKADNEVALLQAMMLLDDNYTVGKFGNVEVFNYASSLRDNTSDIFAKTKATLDYLGEALGDNVEKILLKKLHLPFVVWASNRAMEAQVPTKLFVDWLEGFKEKIISKDNGVLVNGLPNKEAWLYKEGCGAGATKAEKVAERFTCTKYEIEDFIKELDSAMLEDEKDIEKLRLAKEAKEAEQAKAKAEKEKAEQEKAKAKEAKEAEKLKAKAEQEKAQGELKL